MKSENRGSHPESSAYLLCGLGQGFVPSPPQILACRIQRMKLSPAPRGSVHRHFGTCFANYNIVVDAIIQFLEEFRFARWVLPESPPAIRQVRGEFRNNTQYELGLGIGFPEKKKKLKGSVDQRREDREAR